MKNITIPSDKTYLSEVISELPTNCIFDKGAVGCGGTTLAINSKEDYVICVPFVSLVNNKVNQHNNLFAVKEGVSVQAIKEYFKTAETIKIITTYDSLSKVVEALGEAVNSVNLLIDELHLLFTQYTFRKEAVQSVLDLYTRFKSYCFMTATPVKEKYTLKEIKNIPVVKANWNNTVETTIASVKCENVEGTVCAMINQHLENEGTDNLYFFVNSVDFINKVVELCNLNDDNARMICSQSNTGKRKLKLSISDTSSEAMKINFITSTAFEGCDLYDENGRIIIVSDRSKVNTLLDISTSIPQIAGRIRNTKHKDSIIHLYSQTRYTDITVEQHEQTCKSEIEKANQLIKEYNKLNDEAYNAIKEIESVYLFKNNGKWSFDENAVLIDMWNFEICNGIYSFRSRMNDEYSAKGFNVVEGSRYDEQIKLIAKAIDNAEVFTFKEFVQTIKNLSEKTGSEYDLYLATIKEVAFAKYSFLKEAIEVIGYGKMGTMKYNQRLIKSELINQSDLTESSKVIKVAKLLQVKSGDFIASSELKGIIKSIYASLGITKTAKASDITEYFEVNETTRRINGKATKGYSIIRSKITFN